MDRWTGIDSFVAVTETGSFTRGAERLGVSVSHVSRQISFLEKQLGTTLLVRTTRRLALTDAGRIFEERCKRLIEDRNAAFEAVASAGDAPGGHIRLTCTVSYGESTIMPLVNRFIAQNEHISIDVELSNDLRDVVADGFDMAVRMGRTEDKRLKQVKLASRSLYLCASPSYLASRGMPKTVHELYEHSCLVGATRRWYFNSRGHTIQIRPEGRWRCNDGVSVLDATLRGIGISQLPDFYVAPHLQLGSLIEVLPHERPDDQNIWAVFPTHTFEQKKLQTLLGFLQQNISA